MKSSTVDIPPHHKDAESFLIILEFCYTGKITVDVTPKDEQLRIGYTDACERAQASSAATATSDWSCRLGYNQTVKVNGMQTLDEKSGGEGPVILARQVGLLPLCFSQSSMHSSAQKGRQQASYAIVCSFPDGNLQTRHSD